jgi:streptomycin 6-kinase
VADDDHDWVDLATPWRMGPGGVAVAARNMEGLSAGEAVEQICDKLKRAMVQLGADADVARIAAMEAAARALCPEPEAVAQVEPEAQPEPEPVATAEREAKAEEVSAEAEVADAGRSGRPKRAWAAGPSAEGPDSEADHEPPPKPPPD